VLEVNGSLYDSQRFAIDWMRINEDGQIVVDDPSENENYVDYGAKVMAAADGIVVDMLDELEDNVPGQLPDPNSITLKNVDGNYVVIDHGNGLYSFYAHLQRGSVEVEVGDEVQAGDQLGLLGNTGNSSAPHLHFHVMAGPSPVGSDGLAYVLDSFLLAGVADGSEAQFVAALTEGEASFPSRSELDPIEHERELPLDNTILNFPGE
jgi:murein DD-endopeptidase MepM/ murein hydrolase activator NlpD